MADEAAIVEVQH